MNVNKALFGFIKIAFSILVILIVIYGMLRLCHMGYDYGFRLYTEPAMEEAPGRDVLVQIKPDMSLKEIAEMMEEKGLVRESNLFFAQLRLSDYRKSIKPGVYTMNTSMVPKELMKTMAPKEEEKVEDTEEDVFDISTPMGAEEFGTEMQIED